MASAPNARIHWGIEDEDNPDAEDNDDMSMYGPADPSTESERISEDTIDQLRARLGDSVNAISITAGDLWNASISHDKKKEQGFVSGANADALREEDLIRDVFGVRATPIDVEGIRQFVFWPQTSD